MPNVIWTTILIVGLAAATGYAWFFHRKRFLVLLIHNLVWAGALFLIGTGLIDYRQASAGAWLTLAAGLLFFNAGVWGATWLSRSHDSQPRFDDLTAADIPPLVSRRTFWILLAVYGVAFAVYLVNIALRFGLFSLITHPAFIRAGAAPSYLESVPLPFRLLLYLAPLLFAVLGIRSAIGAPLHLAVRAPLMVLLAVTMLALLQRTNLFMAILLLVGLYITREKLRRAPGPRDSPSAAPSHRGRLGRLRVPAAVLAFALVGLVAFQLVGGALGKSGRQVEDEEVSPVLAQSGLTSPFIYYASGTVAFLLLTESTNDEWAPEDIPGDNIDPEGDYNPQTWGVVTFSPVVKLLPFVREWPATDTWIDTGVKVNVYTWLAPFYRDFRLGGVIVGTLLLGLLVGLVHGRRFESARMFWLQGALVSMVFMAPFVPKINNTLLLSVLIFIAVLTSGLPRKALDALRRRTRPAGDRVDA